MRIIVFANGEIAFPKKISSLLKKDDFFICADGGLRYALDLGISPAVLVGDLDSLPVNFDISQFKGKILKYPQDKNDTDLELAIRYAVSLQPKKIIVFGAFGGRVDHSLANISVIGNYIQEKPTITLIEKNIKNTIEVFFTKGETLLAGTKGDIVSLIPWQGHAEGIITKNLRWELHNETLLCNKTRGISNEMIADTARIFVKKGLLLVVHIKQNLEYKM